MVATTQWNQLNPADTIEASEDPTPLPGIMSAAGPVTITSIDGSVRTEPAHYGSIRPGDPYLYHARRRIRGQKISNGYRPRSPRSHFEGKGYLRTLNAEGLPMKEGHLAYERPKRRHREPARVESACRRWGKLERYANKRCAWELSGRIGPPPRAPGR